MAFQLSPGVNFSEIDLTNATAAVGTTEGAIAGVFRWGPINERKLITSETQLVDVFGEPSSRFRTPATNTDFWTNHETFYTAANFLGYSDALYVTRVVETGNADADKNAAIASGGSSNKIKAKYYGELGNSLDVSYCFGDATGKAEFAGGAVGSSKLTILNGNKTAQVTGGASIGSFAKGDKIIVQDGNDETIQELILASTPSPSTGAARNNGEQVINFAARTTGTTEGVVVHDPADATTTENTSIIILENASSDVADGDVVVITGTAGSIPVGLTGGRTYFAITVTAANDGTATGAPSQFIKLAATYEDAINHSDASPKNVLITAAAPDAATQAATININAPSNADLTFTTKYTGLTKGSDGSGTNYLKAWGDNALFDAEPTSATTCHIAVKDKDGAITGTAGTVLEVFADVSVVGGVKKADGTSSFITDILEATSKWIKIDEDDALTFDNASVKSSDELSGGSDGEPEDAIGIGHLALGYDLYKDATEVDVSFILQGKARDGATLSNYIIDNIVESRRDCVAVISPEYVAAPTAQTIVNFRNLLTSSTYAICDTGYKYQYDKYSDVYRWVPLNGDIAGLCARTDDLRDPWFSPAGYNRGSVKNVVKLKFNPNKSQRDLLYKNGVNPVITQAGQGTVLFGDKTLSGTTSAFDRINVRRLFIVLEKTIANAAKSTLFEFNDEFTRATFRNLVEPFLRDVQGRRGIYDFKVICDESNNTGQVIDTNSFVGDIYIKPARSINFIQLNFVAVRTGVEFSEVVGAA